MPDAKTDEAAPRSAPQPAQEGSEAREAEADESGPGTGENQAGFVKDRDLTGGRGQP